MFITTVRKSDRTACQFLYSSAINFLRASNSYSSNVLGDVEHAFGELHKAWDQLLQADKILNKNGTTFLINENGEEGGEFFGITMLMKNKKHLEEDYKHNLATGIFKTLEDKNSPLSLNIDLIREIRNIEQHDHIEQNSSSKIAIWGYCNPFMAANFINFLELYKEIYEKNIIQCRKHTKRQDTARCTTKDIPTYETMYAGAILPHPLAFIQESFSHMTLIQKLIKQDGINKDNETEFSAFLKSEIAYNIRLSMNAFMSNTNNNKKYTKEDNYRFVVFVKNSIMNSEEKLNLDSYKFSAVNEKEINEYLKGFEYENLEKVANKLNNHPKYNFILNRQEVQQIYEALIYDKQIDKHQKQGSESNELSKVFFGKKRYHRNLINLIGLNYNDRDSLEKINIKNIKPKIP